MSKSSTLLVILIFGQVLFAQREIVGKVVFFKSLESEWKQLEYSSDRQIELLNTRQHSITIMQGTTTLETRTDSTGVFKATLATQEKLHIQVNKKSKVLNGSFSFDGDEITDTLRLYISDSALALHIDSVRAPEFYRKYNENRALRDFKEGNRRLLGSGGFLTEKSIKRREKFSKKYGFRYDYIFGCFGDRTRDRIAFRYNATMKKLLGINENVW